MEPNYMQYAQLVNSYGDRTQGLASLGQTIDSVQAQKLQQQQLERQAIQDARAAKLSDLQYNSAQLNYDQDRAKALSAIDMYGTGDRPDFQSQLSAAESFKAQEADIAAKQKQVADLAQNKQKTAMEKGKYAIEVLKGIAGALKDGTIQNAAQADQLYIAALTEGGLDPAQFPKEQVFKLAQATPEYKTRTYNKGNTEVTETSNDGGKTWQPLSTAPRHKPAATGGAGGEPAPTKPLPAGQLEALSDAAQLIKTLEEAQQGEGNVNTGMIMGRLQSLGQKFGMTSDSFTDYKQKLATVNNIMLKLRSGAAVTESEYQRFLQEMPTVNDDERVRNAKTANAISYARELLGNKTATYEEGGYKVPQGLVERSKAAPAKTATKPIPKSGVVRYDSQGNRVQ